MRDADVDKSRSRSSSRRRKRDRIKEFASRCKDKLTVRDTQSSGSSSGGASKDSTESESDIAPSKSDESARKKLHCRPPICHVPLKQHTALGLTFSGCGFLSLYHFGVLKCLLRNGKSLVARVRRVSGASAGSLVAAIMVLAPEELDASMEKMYAMADELNTMPLGALSPGFYLGERLAKTVDELIPQDVAKANHKLFISLTQHKTRENRLVSVYPSREYLLTCLNASCFISVYSMGLSSKPPEVDGEPYVDGGYTNNVPDYSDLRTITVSPFCSNCDIEPPESSVFGFDWKMTVANQHWRVNLRNIVRGAQSIFPPSRTTLEHYYNQGYRDAFKFLLDNDMLERDSGTAV